MSRFDPSRCTGYNGSAMIVDCHTHVWESVEQLGRGMGLWLAQRGRYRPGSHSAADTRAHLAATQPVDRTFVLGFKSHYLDGEIPNDYIARYVAQHPDRLIGFAGVDPSRPKQAIDDLRRAKQELGLRGATIWPAAQDFHPASSAAMRVYTEISRLGMPLIVHHDVRACASCKMEFARPYLIDEVAREFPDLKIVIPQMGYPFTEETLVLLAKHRNVFADMSGLVHKGWPAYTVLLSAYHAEVIDSLLFGSNFPHSTAAACIESLYSINQFCHGTALPTIPREQLRRIVERDTLELLGIEQEADRVRPEPDTTVIQAED